MSFLTLQMYWNLVLIPSSVPPSPRVAFLARTSSGSKSMNCLDVSWALDPGVERKRLPNCCRLGLSLTSRYSRELMSLLIMYLWRAVFTTENSPSTQSYHILFQSYWIFYNDIGLTLLWQLCSEIWVMLTLKSWESSLCPRTIPLFQYWEDGRSVWKQSISLFSNKDSRYIPCAQLVIFQLPFQQP